MSGNRTTTDGCSPGLDAQRYHQPTHDGFQEWSSIQHALVALAHQQKKCPVKVCWSHPVLGSAGNSWAVELQRDSAPAQWCTLANANVVD